VLCYRPLSGGCPTSIPLTAHMARCESMLAAFRAGGDFHSRTAMGMYAHVGDAVTKGSVLLEWDGKKARAAAISAATQANGGAELDAAALAAIKVEPPAPLLKDVYAAERRKAKTLNFSIAYGKTAHGLSKDWGVTLDEAQDTVERWCGVVTRIGCACVCFTHFCSRDTIFIG
jgi:DNA polymerase-1